MAKQLDLPHHYRQQLELLLRKHLPTVEVWAYGSRVNGQSHDGSDLDLVLRSPELQQIPADSLASFSEALRESTIPFLVEAHDWARLPESFHPEIEREHLVLVAADSKPLDKRNPDVGDGWFETTLGDITDFLSGGTPSKSRPDYWNGSVPWVSAKDMKRFRLHDTEDRITAEAVSNGAKLVPAGTVLLLVRGMTLLKKLPVCVTGRPMTFNQDVKALRPKPGVDPAFLPYLVLGNKRRLLSLVDLAGHGTGRLNSEELKSLNVRLPPEDEQRTIAHILGTLDDKIELNRQLNETLEGLVRAIFKDWFVDFGPVRAKLEGRDTGLPEQLAELFPDRLVESELGGIPEGWEVRPVTALVSIVGGGTPKTSVDEYWGGNIPWFSVVDTPPPGSVYVVMTEKTITQKGLQESSARLVPEGTTIISARGTVGNLAMCGRPMAFNQSCYGLRPSSDVGDYFVFLTAHNLVDRLQAMAHGSVFSTITRQTIEAVSVAVAPRAVHLAFEATVRPFFSKIKVNVEEARILAQVRDVLLPRLVSGELRVGVGSRGRMSNPGDEQAG